MKHFSIVFFFLLSYNVGITQVKARTPNGTTVILYPDGTWRYQLDTSKKTVVIALDSTRRKDSILTNPQIFQVSAFATHLVKSKVVDFGVYVDNNLWGIKTCSINEDGEMKFLDKADNCYAEMITEPTEGGLINDMEYFVLNSARNRAPDAEITTREFRMVNGIKVLCLGLKGTVKSLKIELLNYSYADESGIIQLVAWTTQKKFNKNYGVLARFLSGLVQLK